MPIYSQISFGDFIFLLLHYHNLIRNEKLIAIDEIREGKPAGIKDDLYWSNDGNGLLAMVLATKVTELSS